MAVNVEMVTPFHGLLSNQHLCRLQSTRASPTRLSIAVSTSVRGAKSADSEKMRARSKFSLRSLHSSNGQHRILSDKAKPAAALSTRQPPIVLHEDVSETVVHERSGDIVLPQEEGQGPTFICNEWAEVPVIDLSGMGAHRSDVARQMGEAARDWGAFQLVNHGIALETLQRLETEGFDFFGLPLDRKQRCGTAYTGNNTLDEETSLNLAESMLLNACPYCNRVGSKCGTDEQVLLAYPDGNPPLSDALGKFRNGSEAITDSILQLLAEYLGLDSDFFAQHFGAKAHREFDTPHLRWNYYPASSTVDVLGAKVHTDPTVITIIQQDRVGGLQILRDGLWYGVKPIEGALVVNIGDTMHAWSNGIFKTLLHRVVLNKDSDRLSLAGFVNTDSDFLVSAPDELVSEDLPRRYHPYVFGDFVKHLIARRLDKNRRSSVNNGMQTLQEFST